MSQVNWAEDRLESKHNSTQSNFWRHLGDHPLVPVLSYVSSLNTLSWIWPKKKMAWYTMLERPSACRQAQTLYSIPFLRLCCSFMDCTCPLVACFGLSRGGWMLKCVWQKRYPWCCMQPSYDAFNGKKTNKKKTYQMAGSVSISLYCNAICNATLYPLLAKRTCLNGVVLTGFIFHSSSEVFFVFFLGVGHLLQSHTYKYHINVVTSDLYRDGYYV